MPKKVLIALSPVMLDKIDALAIDEHRTRSDLIREALRRYLKEAERSGIQLEELVESMPPRATNSRGREYNPALMALGPATREVVDRSYDYAVSKPEPVLNSATVAMRAQEERDRKARDAERVAQEQQARLEERERRKNERYQAELDAKAFHRQAQEARRQEASGIPGAKIPAIASGSVEGFGADKIKRYGSLAGVEF